MPKFLSILILSLIFFIQCTEDKKGDVKHIDRIVVHLQDEPQRLSPILETTSYERMVSEHVFLSLCDFDPVSLDLVPVLAKEVPVGHRTVDKEGRVITTYSIELLDDAVWSDGSAMTGEDFAFTMKLVSLPYVTSPGWKNLLQSLVDIKIDENNPKKFEVQLEGDYFLQKDGLLSAEIYPRYIYDPKGTLSAESYRELVDKNWDQLDSEVSNPYQELYNSFSSTKMTREVGIEGSGPYTLKAWESGQYLVLAKKDNWWGDNYPDRTLLQAYPKEIIYQIIKDQTVALTQMKGGNLDIMSLSSSPVQVFNDLKNDDVDEGKYIFKTPSLFRIYYVLLNNQDKRLSDIAVRRALAHVLDVNRIIDIQEDGMGTRMNSPIHPARPEFNRSLKLVNFDVDKAKSLLSDAGWMDVDGDGIREKIVNGQKLKLDLRFFISGSKLSTSISTILKENASLAGINIELITKAGKATRSENIYTGDFEMTAQAITGEARPDPFGAWHSSSVGTNGANMAGYSNEKADRLMEIIRTTQDEPERMQAYAEFQEIIAEDQPVLFLYAPVERLVISSKFEPLISSKRPGFFINSFKSSSL